VDPVFASAIFITGLAFGSFLNVCIYRLPRELSVVTPRSACPNCKQAIAAYDNIPVLSWLILGGRCRHCRTRISPRYLMIEVLTGVLFLACYWYFGLTLSTVKYCAFAFLLLGLIFTDAETKLLPDKMTLPGLALGLLFSVIVPVNDLASQFLPGIVNLPFSGEVSSHLLSLLDSLLGAALGASFIYGAGAIYLRWRGMEGMGFGDVKLMAMVGAFLGMLGSLFVALAGALRRPASLRMTSLVYQLHRVGFQAIPIMVLITFLIGAIIAQQGFFHFRKFGADSYVVDMVGILVLRELGVLIVAIMVAGRSGSAYTAELGSMKMREEIDALSTMGLDPVEVLILPRIVALIIALPILSFIGSVAALYGGGLVAQFYGDMAPAIYIARLHDAVSVTSFKVGIIKAPFMALAIGIIACSEGLRVKGSAESLGKQTTTSVVKSIFLVIVLDGLFAVFFASIGM